MIDKFLTYLQYEKKYSTHTVISYEKDLMDFQHFLAQTVGEIKWENITLHIVRNYMYELSFQNYSERTINRKLSSLKSFFKFLKNCGLITQNPAILAEALKQPKKVIIPLSQTETKNLQTLELLENDYKSFRNQLIIELLYQTGIRRVELINIKETDISFANKQLKVLGKRNKERFIPLSDNLLESIKRFLSLKRKNNQTSGMFFEGNSQNKLSEKTVYNIVTNRLNEVTTKAKVSPHILRHTFATHLLQNGAEINAVKDLLGHASLAATQVYTHQDIKQLKKVFNKAHPRERNKN